MDSQDFEEKHLNSCNQEDSQKFLTKVSRYKIDRLSSREHRRKSQKDQPKRVELLSLFNKSTNNSYEGKGFWNSEERARYLQFLDQQKALWTNETRRKDWKAMSKFVRTRSPAQCQAYYYFQINKELYKAKLKLKKELKRKLKSKLNSEPKSRKVSHSESSQEPVQKLLFTMDEIQFLLEAKIELENKPEIQHETNPPETIKNEFNPFPSETIKNEVNVPEEFKNEEIRHFSMATQSYCSQNTSENSDKINKGPWSSEEQALYLRFIEQYKALGKNDDRRKARFYFNLMSACIRTRDPAQCKSHDQKIRRKMDKSKPECENNLSEIIENEFNPSETIKYEVKTTKVKKEEKIEDLSIPVKLEFSEDLNLKSEPTTNSANGFLIDLKPKIEMELENEQFIKHESNLSETIKNEFNPSETTKNEPSPTEVIKEEKIEDLSIPVKLEFPQYISNIQNENLESVWPLAFFLNMYSENNFIIPHQVQQRFESMNYGQDEEIIPKIEDNMRY